VGKKKETLSVSINNLKKNLAIKKENKNEILKKFKIPFLGIFARLEQVLYLIE
jgi:hypothetical protein